MEGTVLEGNTLHTKKNCLLSTACMAQAQWEHIHAHMHKNTHMHTRDSGCLSFRASRFSLRASDRGTLTDSGGPCKCKFVSAVEYVQEGLAVKTNPHSSPQKQSTASS